MTSGWPPGGEAYDVEPVAGQMPGRVILPGEETEVKMHLLDADKAWGVRCNNPHAIGSATSTPGDVTCVICRQAPRRSRYGGRTARDDSTRVPPGPAGGD